MRRLGLMLIITGMALSAWGFDARAANTHPFSVHDMLAMERISDPQVAPDAKRIVFVLRKTDLEANKGVTDLWLVNLDGTGLHQLTSDAAADSNPRWAPDGQAIWFLSTRSGSSQVWRVAPDGGEAIQITDEPLDITSLNLSRNGQRIAYSMEVFPSLSPTETKKRLDEIAESKVTGRIYERLFIRHWDTWKDGRRSHIFARNVETLSETSPVAGGVNLPEAVDLMKGINVDCPTKPFGGPEDYTFTPDGESIVYAAYSLISGQAWSTNVELHQVPCDRSSRPSLVTLANKAWDGLPVFSPSGKQLAQLAMSRAGYESDKVDVTILNWPPGRAWRILTYDWDRSAGSMTWSRDGREIYVTANNLGQRSLFAISMRDGSVKTLVRDGTVSNVRVAGERIVFGLDTLHSPVELYSIKRDGTDMKPITRINQKKVAAARMGKAEQFTFHGWKYEPVRAYVVKPVDFDPAKKYPVAFLIHGGPQGSFGNHFHYRWNPQAYAGAGYGVIMVDFHGSTGYGQEFCDSIRGDWGGKPLEDLQKGLRAALKRYRWMDDTRVAALGASFGGYMINWIAGNWPNTFRCLVNHDGNLDERMAYYDTEELWFPEWDHQGTPWSNPNGYEKHNPINFVKNWDTPMLVIHGALDYRVVDTQGISTFTALQRRGIPSKLLYFPDENHWVQQPANSILWHDTVIAWLDQWTKE